MNARQRPELTPFVDVTRPPLVIREVTRNADGSMEILTARGAIQLDSRGRVSDIEAQPIEFIPTVREDTLASARRRVTPRSRARPRESVLWDLIPPPPPEAPGPGMVWTDTTHFGADPLGVLLEERAVVRHRVIGDTLIDGRRLWLVRDSGTIEQMERTFDPMSSLAGIATTERQTRGLLSGWSLFDSEANAFVLRTDTTLLAGTASLLLPDGRSVTSDTRVERLRTIRLYRPEQYAIRVAQLAAERDSLRALQGGMVRPRLSEIDMSEVPISDLQRRLLVHDTVAHDSVVQRMRTTRDANERTRLYDLLREWSVLGVPGDLAFELADTTSILGGSPTTRTENRIAYSWRGTIDDDELDWWQPALADPAYAFAFDVDADAHFADLTGRLSRAPAVLEPDTARWPCTPSACERVFAWAEEAEEPRMRDLGLLAKFMFDPAEWVDSVLARPESSILGRARELATGVGATFLGSARAPLPDPGADWRPWLDWLSATDPALTTRSIRQRDRFRSDASHVQAIQVQSLLTDRDFEAEFRSGMENAQTDSAYALYRVLLDLVAEVEVDPETAAAHLLSPSAVLQRIGQSELGALWRQAEPLDSARFVELSDTLLAMALAGAPEWPSTSPNPMPISSAFAGTNVYLARSSLPVELSRRWESRASILSNEEVAALSTRDEHVLVRLSPGRQVGRFVFIGISYDGWLEAAPNEVPRGWAGARSVWLLQTENGWVVVGGAAVIT